MRAKTESGMPAAGLFRCAMQYHGDLARTVSWAAWALGAASSPALGASYAVIGKAPAAAQIGAASGGTLYGTLPTQGDGVLFTLPIEGGGITTLHAFTAAKDGSAPNARLALGHDGTVYGTARDGGASGAGTLWSYGPQSRFRNRHSFGANGDGAAPMQGPTLGGRDILYGATGEGAIGGSGNLFMLGRQDPYDVMYEFKSGADGHCPFSGVALARDGTLYGTTVGVGYGGNPNGSVWKYDAAGTLTTLYVFQDGTDGEWPDQAPALDSRGNLYGTTHVQNGDSFAGAIWRIAPDGHFAVLHPMNGATDGYGPNSPLLPDGKDTLYGTTYGGGTGGYGTVFSITRLGVFTVLHSFQGGDDGAQPTGNLVRAGNGVIYGGTSTGQVFAVTP